MRTEFHYKNIHSCEAVVLTCVDFRFWKETLEFIDKEAGIKCFDFPSLPGSAKAINDCLDDDETSMKCITVPCDLHHVKKIIIVNHADCGAYGGSAKFNGDIEAEQEFHEQELRKAREKLQAKYPDREIILFYAKLDAEQKNIEFISVT